MAPSNSSSTSAKRPCTTDTAAVAAGDAEGYDPSTLDASVATAVIPLGAAAPVWFPGMGQCMAATSSQGQALQAALGNQMLEQPGQQQLQDAGMWPHQQQQGLWGAHQQSGQAKKQGSSGLGAFCPVGRAGLAEDTPAGEAQAAKLGRPGHWRLHTNKARCRSIFGSNKSRQGWDLGAKGDRSQQQVQPDQKGRQAKQQQQQRQLPPISFQQQQLPPILLQQQQLRPQQQQQKQAIPRFVDRLGTPCLLGGEPLSSLPLLFQAAAEVPLTAAAGGGGDQQGSAQEAAIADAVAAVLAGCGAGLGDLEGAGLNDDEDGIAPSYEQVFGDGYGLCVPSMQELLHVEGLGGNSIGQKQGGDGDLAFQACRAQGQQEQERNSCLLQEQGKQGQGSLGGQQWQHQKLLQQGGEWGRQEQQQLEGVMELVEEELAHQHQQQLASMQQQRSKSMDISGTADKSPYTASDGSDLQLQQQKHETEQQQQQQQAAFAASSGTVSHGTTPAGSPAAGPGPSPPLSVASVSKIEESVRSMAGMFRSCSQGTSSSNKLPVLISLSKVDGMQQQLYTVQQQLADFRSQVLRGLASARAAE